MKAGRPPRLTVPAVLAIRREYDTARAAGRRPRAIRFADRYGMNRNAISLIGLRLTYRWVQ